MLRTRNRLVRIWFVNNGFDADEEPNSPKSGQIGCRRLPEQKAFRFTRLHTAMVAPIPTRRGAPSEVPIGGNEGEHCALRATGEAECVNYETRRCNFSHARAIRSISA